LRRWRAATDAPPARSGLDSAARPRVGLRVAVDGRQQFRPRVDAPPAQAMPVWQEASVDPFIGGEKAPSIVKREREIPADVQGCCCGSVFSDNDPFPGPVQLP